MKSCKIYLYLTMGEDGKGKLTHRKPIWARVEGTCRHAPYPRPGEPVEMKGLCPEWIEKVLGKLPPPGVPIRLQLDVTEIESEKTTE